MQGGRVLRIAAASITLASAGCGGAREAAPEPPVTAATELGRIDVLIAERRYRAALEAIDAGLAQRPDDVDLLDLRVRVLRHLGLERQALEQVLALRQVAPQEERFAYEAGELAARLGDGKRAREQFAAARALAPNDWRPAVAEAALCLGEKPPNVAGAESLLAPWLEGPQARVEARYHQALAVEARGEAPAALAAFEHALELDPYHVPSLCNAARLAEAAGEKERALTFLQRARATVSPDDDSLLHELDGRIARLNPPHDR
jgi:tetratricopeptide (TPR) repeat protein